MLKTKNIETQKKVCQERSFFSEVKVPLCDPMECSPPDSFVYGIFQARVLERVSFPSIGDVSDPGIEPRSPALHADSLPSKPPGRPSFSVLEPIVQHSVQFSSVQSLSRVQLFATPWITAGQASLSITNSQSSPRPTSIKSVMPSSHLILSSPSPPAPNPSQCQSLFQWVNSSHEVAKVLEFQLQHQSFQRNPRADLLQNGLVGSPCRPRDSQESSPTPQFKSINSLALSLLHSPTLTSISDHRKNHSLD